MDTRKSSGNDSIQASNEGRSRQNGRRHPKAKELARKHYGSRQFKKWMLWRWDTVGRITYKEIVEQRKLYELE